MACGKEDIGRRVLMIEIEHGHGSTVLCRPSCSLDFPSSLTLRHVIADILRPGLKIVIDLRHVRAVDSVGVSALIGTGRRVRSLGGTAHIINANPRLRCLLRSVGAEQLLAEASVTSSPDAA
jgi:anti-anti-sigma factor